MRVRKRGHLHTCIILREKWDGQITKIFNYLLSITLKYITYIGMWYKNAVKIKVETLSKIM